MNPRHCTKIKFLQASLVFLLFFNLVFSSIPFTLFFLFLSTIRILSLSLFLSVLISFLYFLLSRPKPIFLLNYSCFKPNPSQKCNSESSKHFVFQTPSFSQESQDFQLNIYLKSGLGEETYVPRFVLQQENRNPNLESPMEEAREGIFASVDSLLSKTNFDPSLINVLVVTSGSFSPSPSLSSLITNHYSLKSDVKSYNLSGMGCCSGVTAVDLAAKVLHGTKKVGYALVIATECISMNWYNGNYRPMLVTNVIFRVGCAAVLITNDPSYRRVAKMELVSSLRTHHGADDQSYKAAFQEEDDKGITGISLTKDLIRVAGVNLREHIKILAWRFLPLSQLVRYGYSVLMSTLPRSESKPIVPDFTTGFDHFCIHTGGKAVIESVGRVLRLDDELTEPSRMTLHRFGNTSSSLVFYELSYFEAKRKLKKGEKVWMLAFGTGFKVSSLVWKMVSDSTLDCDNPWNDCIHSYPLKSW